MACSAITSGILDSCNTGFSGIDKIFIANGNETTSFTEAAGVVTAINVDAVDLTPADFYTFETPRQTSSLDETITVTQENGTVTYQQDITMVFNQMEAAKRNEILLMAQATSLIIVAKDNNNRYWSVGLQFGGYMTAGTAASGVAYSDRNGFSITLSGLEKTPMFEVTSTIVEAA